MANMIEWFCDGEKKVGVPQYSCFRFHAVAFMACDEGPVHVGESNTEDGALAASFDGLHRPERDNEKVRWQTVLGGRSDLGLAE